ncbi:MAG: bifunctional serine/threonine-protein kinase/formylglycine-generating enzyme family protein [Planctomycetaceae bacterium]
MSNPQPEFDPLETASEAVEKPSDVELSPSGETQIEDVSAVSKPVFHPAVRTGRVPERIGRYRIQKQLGKGSFGAVYLGCDESGQLAAVKIAEFKPGTRPDVVRRIQQTLQQEAEAVRNLAHPHIVRLLDFHLPDGQPGDWFLVYAYIDGGTLKERLKSGPLDPLTATTMMAKLADALYAAHLQKVIHRDLKPANIMLDLRGEPYLADFGLAVTESEMLRREDTAAGTPLYYSPEQADGEPHLVNYRTDIYSLGATFYEMLTGKPPFADHRNSTQLKKLILDTPPRSLQMENPSLPDALDHICQRALRKRQDERFRYAGEMAQELREVERLLQAQPVLPNTASSIGRVPAPSLSHGYSQATAAVTGQSTDRGVSDAANSSSRDRQGVLTEQDVGPLSDGRRSNVQSLDGRGSSLHGLSVRGSVAESDAALSRIEPKGLRSFDQDDADYFLHLLPGTRDKWGLPVSISEWKRQIEQTRRDETFTVGLMYGPSGCGKSSLVKAGLIPRLSPAILPVYLEATPTGTEDRIRQLVSRECPLLCEPMALATGVSGTASDGKSPDASAFGSKGESPDASAFGSQGDCHWPLNEFLKTVRRDPLIRKGRKLLIVIDQFEQWLHVNRSEMRATELVRALRQADGENLQFLLLIREDFWVPTSRLFHELEVPLIDGVNSRLVDLFDLPHARRVLHAFGAAYERLPPLNAKLTAAQEQFLDDAVTGMSEDHRVICVRLSLFAHMLHEREWTPATFREVGGAAGVGVAFLEETFGSQARHPELRYFEKPVRGILKALLPEVGTDLKGQRRTREFLQEAAELTEDAARFQRLMDILDRELRIITPVADEASAGNQASYQLAHDYLVPSIRDWLTRKQRETWRGRAELTLAERTTQWLRTRERRFFPSVAEYLAIQAGVPRHRRSQEQRQLLRAARRWYGLLLALIVVAVGSLGVVAWETNGRTQGRRLAQQIVSAVPSELPRILDQDLPGYRRWADPLLRAHLQSDAGELAGSPMQLRASLALLDVDDSQTEGLSERLLSCAFEEFPIIRDRLAKSSERVERLVPTLWPIFRGTDNSLSSLSAAVRLRARLKAGMALASWNEHGHWTESDITFLAERLTAENPIHQAVLLDALRPLAARLTPILEVRFRDASLRETERSAAASALADFAAEDAQRIARLLTDAEPAQFEILFPLAAQQRAAVLPIFQQIAAREPSADLSDVERIALGKQRAGAAVALLRLKDATHAFEALRVRDDPEARTQFAHRQRSRGVTTDELLDALEMTSATESPIRFGLLIALGEFPLDDIPARRREKLIALLEDWYRHDPRSSIHGAAGWLLRSWQQTQVVTEVDQTPLAYDPTGQRDWFVDVVRGEIKGEPFADGFTFVVFPPGDFDMGSPLTEQERTKDEAPHRVRLTRPIAFCDRELTVAQWEHFETSTGIKPGWSADHSPTPAHPMNSARWYDSLKYCRWLTQTAGRSEGEQCYDDPASVPLAAGAAPTSNPEPEDWPFHLERPGYRLPTEAEWEYASRAGMRSCYGFASDRGLMPLYATYLDTSANKTRIVADLRPNSRGLFDMHGNILEWCHDWFVSNYDTSTLQIDPHGSAKSATRVLRGGSWSSAARDCRSADRHDYAPVFRGYRVGLRIVQVPGARTADP